MVEIRTERLVWRHARTSDLEALHRLVSDYEVVKNTATWPHPADRALSVSRCQPFDSEVGLVGHVFREDQLVGAMGVARFETDPEMGYMLARAHWGKGYATEIGRALLDACFARYDWPHVSACVFDGNPGSARVLEKLGFVATGRCKGPCKARGADLPMQTFRLARP